MIKLFLMLTSFISLTHAEIIGHVDTKFNISGADDHILVEAFDDPVVSGVTCHLSRAARGKTIKNLFGLAATHSSDASIACRQTGDIRFKKQIAQKERVFRKSTSPLFKSMQVIRFVDTKRNTLIYLVYSDKIVDGSPKNSLSTVPIILWGNAVKADVKWNEILKGRK